MPDNKPTLLIVEDDPDVADMLNAYFHVQGYDVVAVNWGEDAINACRSSCPDLIILDIRLPDIDGYEVARRLRSSRRTAEVPIIFLTEKRARADRLLGLELGADDYITKPFDIQELRLRVRNALRRTTQGPLTNPVTGLPEGALVDERLQECLTSRQWEALLIALDNVDAFRDAYGFVASDDVLRAVGLMIQNAVRDIGSPSDFVGQVSHAEFVLITTLGSLAVLRERIHTRLHQSLEYFYPLKDREEHHLLGRKLAVNMRQLSAENGPFPNLAALKSELLGRQV